MIANATQIISIPQILFLPKVLADSHLRSELEAMLSALLADFQRGSVNEAQVQHAANEAIYLAHIGDRDQAISWMRTARKLVREPDYVTRLRSLGYKPPKTM